MTKTDIDRCPSCGGRVLLHCTDSRLCDLFDCADHEVCRGFGTRDGKRWTRRPRPAPGVKP